MLPDVDIRKTDINYREAPDVSAVVFDKVKISSHKTDHLNAVRPQSITIEPVGGRMPEINAEVPLIGKADDISDVTVQIKTVDIPETEVSMHDLGEVSVRKISVDIPDTVINTGYRSAEISVSRSAEAVSVPNIPKNADIPAVNVSIDADIPTVKLHSAVYYAPVTIRMTDRIAVPENLIFQARYSLSLNLSFNIDRSLKINTGRGVTVWIIMVSILSLTQRLLMLLSNRRNQFCKDTTRSTQHMMR